MKNCLGLFCLLALCSNFLSAQKTWIGLGAGGSGTNFNTASNWSPSGVPASTDNVTIAITSNATITLSANADVKDLTFTVSGNNKTTILEAGNNTLTINGTSIIDALNGNGNTFIAIGVYNGSGNGIVDFKGDVNLGPTSNHAAAYFAGNANSKLIFRSNLTLGDDADISSSTSLIPGVVEFDGTGTQTITWNNTQHNTRFNNVIIGNTNNPTVVQTAGTKSPDNIMGNLTINGSSVLNLGTSFLNRISSGGSFTMNGSSVLRLGNNTGGQTGSNFPFNFSTVALGSGSTVEYNGIIAQTIYDVPSTGYGNLTLTNSSTKTAGGGLTISGALLINSTAVFSAGAGLSHSVSGNWSNTGTFTASTSTITFNGSTQQAISGSAILTFYNLVVDNTAGNAAGDILLNGIDAVISNSCNFIDGIINSATSNQLLFSNGATVSGAGNSSFVNVKVCKTGNDAFTFPVGKLNVGYMPCSISAPANTTDAFTAEYKRNNASSLGPISAAGLYRVSACEYWTLDRTTGVSNVNVTLSWNGTNPCNAAAYVTNLSDLVVSHFDGSSWNAYGNNGGTTGNASAGTVTWNNVSTFSPFTFGSTSSITNPLPVKFSSVKVLANADGDKIEWTNSTEEYLRQYEIQRSANGMSFNTIFTVAPKGNDGNLQRYTLTDEHPLMGTSFYRIKALRADLSYEYSAIVKIVSGITEASHIFVYPNPIATTEFTIHLSNFASGSYCVRLINQNGRQVLRTIIAYTGGTSTITLNRPSSVHDGVYILQIEGMGIYENQKLVFQ